MTPLERYQFDGEQMSFYAPTYDQMDSLTFKMARDLADHEKKMGIKMDLVIAVANGGLTPAAKFAREAGIEEKVLVLGASSFHNMERTHRVVITHPLAIRLYGRKGIVIDDTSDGGFSMNEICNNYLPKKAQPDQLTRLKNLVTPSFLRPKNQPETAIWSGVHFVKDGTIFQPTIAGMHMGHEWIIFPDDMAETVATLGPRWLLQGVSENETLQRLGQLMHVKTIPDRREQVDYFWNKLLRERHLADKKSILISA